MDAIVRAGATAARAVAGARWGSRAALVAAVIGAAACGSAEVTTEAGGTSGGTNGGTVGVGGAGVGGGGQGGGGTTSSLGGAGGQGTGTSTGTPSGLPCDVADVIASACASCHGSPPAGGAPSTLLSYADLTAPSAVDPNLTNAQRSVARMQNAQSPMPPGNGVTATPAQIAALQAFIDAGYPKGECGDADAGAPPPDAGVPVDFPNDPAQCTSKLDWFLGNSLGDVMNPGKACNECHQQKGKVVFAAAGTVYPTGHEPDLCIASGSNGAEIELTDKNGAKTTLKANLSGNFSAKSIAGFTPPYTAKVIFKGQERAMIAPQTSGDCNSCHTQNGASGAPGRIRLP